MPVADAEKLIRSFRSGLYWPHINFHTGGLSQFLARQFEIREQAGKPFGFVSYAALDFPNVHFELGRVSEALVDGGQLVIFCPSVTQVGDCVKYIQQHNISLNLQNVVELGEGVSNGRKWDLRLVAPRFGGTNSANPTPSHLNESSTEIEEEEVVQEATISAAEHPVTKSREQVMVCRPKVGDRVVGGGFVGLWRKARALPSDVSDEVEAHDGESCNHPIGNGRVTTASKQQDTLVSDMVPSFRVTSHETSVAELLQDADSVIARIVSLPPAQTIASEYIQSQLETIHKAANTVVGGRLLKRAHLNPGYTARKHVDLERSPSMLWARSNESSRMIRNIATDLAYHIVKAVLRKFQSASAIDLTEPLVGRAPDQRALLLQYADRMERDLLRRHQERLNRFPTDEKDLRDQFTLFPDMDDFRAWVTDTVSKLSSLARALTVCRINKDMQDPAPVVNASTSVTLDLQQSRTKNVADAVTLVDVMGSAQFARYRQLEVIMSDLETWIKLDPFQYSGRYVMNPAPEVSMTLNTARAITNQIGSSFHQIEHLWSLSDDIQVKTHDVANWMPFHQETQARMRLRESHRQLLVRDTPSLSADRKSRISRLETNIRESLRKTEELFSKQVEVVWRIIFRHSLDIQLIRLRQLSSRCGSSQGERDLLQYEMGRMILLYVRIYFPKAASSWLRRPWKLVTLRATQTVLSPTHPAIKYLLGEAAQADRKPQQVAHPQRRGRTPINDQVITGETLKNEYSIPSPFNWSAHAPGSDIVDLTAPTESKQEDPTRDEAAAFSKPDYSLKPKSVAYTPLHVRDGPDPGSGDRLATSVPSVSAISHSHKTASEPSEDVDTDDGNDRVGVDEQMVPPPDTDDPYADVETPASYSHRKVRPRLVRRTSYPTSTIRKRRGTRP